MLQHLQAIVQKNIALSDINKLKEEQIYEKK